MARKKEVVIEEAISLGIEVFEGDKSSQIEEKIAKKKEELKLKEEEEKKQENVELSTGELLENSSKLKEEIESKKNRNSYLESENKRMELRNVEISKNILTEISEEDSKEKDVNEKAINENLRQISKNINTIKELNIELSENEKEVSGRISSEVKNVATEYIKAKNYRERFAEDVYCAEIEILYKKEDLAVKNERELKEKLDKVVNRYNLGNIGNDLIELEKELELEKPKFITRYALEIKKFIKNIMVIYSKIKTI